MNVATIEMPFDEALAKVAAYRKSLKRRADEEYEACLAGYKALADGKRLVHLSEAIRSGGFDDQMRPRLAVARADRRLIRFQWYEGTVAVFDGNQGRGRQFPQYRIEIDMRRGHGRTTPQGMWAWIDAYAMVPLIPAQVRRAKPGDLRELVILWEVERWHERRRLVQPDKDPMLLKQVHGEFYAVVAEWELTDLERAVMMSRAEDA